MREIGGYIELDKYTGSMLYDDAVLLNCGRNALAYLIESRKIRKISLPYFICNSVTNVCKKYGLDISYYRIGRDWLPLNLDIGDGEWVYIVNYYGQIEKDIIARLVDIYGQVIVDNAQAYFEKPLNGVDTIYTCRKFFGVSDGSILYTNQKLGRVLPIDESLNKIRYVLGRFERSASEFYSVASENNDLFDKEDIKLMSKLTKNLLHAIDYDYVKQRRTENFRYLHKHLNAINSLDLKCVEGAFMYPLMIDNAQYMKQELLKHKIYIPTLWPNIVEEIPHNWLEWNLAANVLPLPCDQRYGEKEMRILIDCISLFYKGSELLV